MSAPVNSKRPTAKLKRAGGTIVVSRNEWGIRAHHAMFFVAGDSARIDRAEYATEAPYTLWIGRAAIDLRSEREARDVCAAIGIAMPAEAQQQAA